MGNDPSPAPIDSTDRLIQAGKEAAHDLAEANKEAAITLAEVQSEASLRNRALTFSIIVTTIIISAHIWFCYVGKTLTIPDIVWAIVLAPWIGAGSSKIVDLITSIRPKKQ